MVSSMDDYYAAEGEQKWKLAPFPWLIGRRLAAVYEQHFGMPAGVSSSPGTNDPIGPFIRFVQSTCGN